MGKHNMKTHEGAKRSRTRDGQDGQRPRKTKLLAKAHKYLSKRLAAYDSLPLDKQKARNRPGCLKTRTN